MLKYKKRFLLDENHKPCAVQLSIADFQRIEDALENYGLAQLIDENSGEKALGLDEAKSYYKQPRASKNSK